MAFQFCILTMCNFWRC